jgi:outer membrane protein TolC
MRQAPLNKLIVNVILVFIVATVFTVNSNAQEEEIAVDTLEVTLERALEIALSENPTIKVSEKEIKRVYYSKKERIGGLLPNVSISGAYQRAVKKQKMYLDGAFDMMGMFPPGVIQDWVDRGVDLTVPGAEGGGGDDAIEVGRDNTFQGDVTASLPVIAPALWATLNLSEIELEMANESARSSRLSLVNQVSKAYYAVLLAQDSYNVIKKSFDNTKANAEVVYNKYKQGTVSEFEWIRADVQTRNANSSLVSAESAVNLSRLQLKMLMGIDMYTEIAVDGKLEDFQKTMYGDLMMVDTAMLDSNTDLKQIDIQAKQLEQSRKINVAGVLPTLMASINYSYMSMVNDNQTFSSNHVWFPTSSLGVQLTIPIFQGGTKYHKNKQIRIQQQQLEYQRTEVRRGLELQVISYLDNMKKAMENIESNKEGMRQAEKALMISRKMYDVGMATFLDLSNSELLYIQSGLAYNQSVYDYVSAKADLEKVLGVDYSK